MPTFADCIKLEEAKQPSTLRLIRKGIFFRAYNHSAWYFNELFVDYYKVNRKYIKSVGQDIYFIGCPHDKLLDLLSGWQYVKTDYGLDITIPDDKLPQDEGKYEAWKKTAKESDETRTASLPFAMDEQSTMQIVCQQIREWPVESKTMLETLTFFGSLRTQLIRQTTPPTQQQTQQQTPRQTDGTLF